jgi:serralysin
MLNRNSSFLIGNTRGDNVLIFDAATGNSLGEFIAPGLGGLDNPDTLLFGPDGNDDGKSDLYIASGKEPGSSSILRFDGQTGEFIDVFVGDNPDTDLDESGGLVRPYGIAYGPDGNFYVSSFLSDQILRYNGYTGEFIDVFAQGNGQSGGLNGPNGLLFINDSLYVTTQGSVATVNPQTGVISADFSAGLPSQILHYDSLEAGATPTVFATPQPSSDSFGFVSLLGLALGEDNDLYVSDFANDIHRYDLQSGELVDTLSTNYTTNTPRRNNFIGGLAFAPNGDLLTVGFNVTTVQGTILQYDTEGGSPVSPFEVLVPTDPVLERPVGITFFPTESKLVFGTSGNDDLKAGVDLEGVVDIVFTGAGDDKVDLAIKSYASNNRVFLGSGNDIIDVSKSDRAFGGSGDDIFDASDSQGGNRMSGGIGNDTFYLGSGDRALGGAGADLFVVQSGGDNLLAGGAGADEFQIVNAELPETANTILDFDVNTDVISIRGAASLGISAATLLLHEISGNTVISFGDKTLAILHDVTGLAVNVVRFEN